MYTGHGRWQCKPNTTAAKGDDVDNENDDDNSEYNEDDQKYAIIAIIGK